MTDIEAAIAYALTDEVLQRIRDEAVGRVWDPLNDDGWVGERRNRARRRDVERAQTAAARSVILAAVVPVVVRLLDEKSA